jgi:hypothetical protein
MKKLIVVFSMVALSLSAAFGQGDPQYKISLNKMLEVGGSEESFKVVMKQMFDMLKQQKTNVPDNVWADFEKEFSKTSIDDLVDLLIPVYQKHMTIADLQKIIEFYQTPVGKKYAEKTPMIMQESMQVGQQWGMDMGQKFQEKLQQKGY